MSDKQFAGKVVLVTGATSGIGKACAQAFNAAGAKVAIVGRNDNALQSLTQELEAKSGEMLALRADLSVDAEATKLVPMVKDQFGGIDVLVNAAGHISSGTIETTSIGDWDKMMNVNVRAIFGLTQQALPSLIERKGNIVNISSVTGLRSFPGVLAYCVSDRKSTRLNSSHLGI